MVPLYPIVLKLAGRPCVVCGGGTVAERKVQSLLEAGAAVTVVSPTLTAALQRLATAGHIVHRARTFEPRDLDGAFLVIAATNDEALNAQVSAEAERRGQLVNVVDTPHHGNFFVPAAVRRGPLLIAVSTGGQSPLLARRIREELEDRYGPEYEDLLNLLGEWRETVQQKMDSEAARKRVWERVLESDLLALLRAGKHEEAREWMESCIF